MLFGAHIKKALVSWFIKNVRLVSLGHVYYFHRNFIFHSLPPCASLVHVCNSSTVISQISAPPLSIHLHPTTQRERDYVGEIFLKCLIFLHAKNMMNLRKGLIVSPDDSVQLWNKLETVSMKEKKRERNRNVFLWALSFILSLSVSLSSSFFFFAVSRLYFRLTVRNEVVLHRLTL